MSLQVSLFYVGMLSFIIYTQEKYRMVALVLIFRRSFLHIDFQSAALIYIPQQCIRVPFSLASSPAFIVVWIF
jgi:hypothetical protein